jgi:hypothetical protein
MPAVNVDPSEVQIAVEAPSANSSLAGEPTVENPTTSSCPSVVTAGSWVLTVTAAPSGIVSVRVPSRG